MKKIDKDGLTICKFQGDIFASSLEYTECSSEIFIRRFMMSNIIKEFDSLAVLDDSLTILDIFQKIELEFGQTNYGSVQYEKEVLFWMGYLYRYFAYTYNLTSKYIYKILKPKELNQMYYVYHTFDPGSAIERILEEKNICFDEDKQNALLLKLMRRKKYEKEVEIKEMNTTYAHQLFKDLKNDVSLFKNKEDFKEYSYSKEIIDSYVERKNKDGFILLAILYKNDVVGEIRFKEFDSVSYELGIILKDDRYKNKGLGTTAIKKAMLIAKDELNIKTLVVKILKTNDRSIHIFKKLGFSYLKEENDFVYFKKTIKNEGGL